MTKYIQVIKSFSHRVFASKRQVGVSVLSNAEKREGKSWKNHERCYILNERLTWKRGTLTETSESDRNTNQDRSLLIKSHPQTKIKSILRIIILPHAKYAGPKNGFMLLPANHLTQLPSKSDEFQTLGAQN